MVNREVYIVDDNADYQLILKQVFSRFLPSYNVHLFQDGNALYQHLQTNPTLPGLILLDMHMPGLNGYQTLSLLKQEPTWEHIPTVIISAFASTDEIRQCYDAGASSCLSKAVSLDELRQQMQLVCQYCVETKERNRLD